MSKQIPLKEEYVDQLLNLDKAKKNLTEELGKIGLQELLIEKRRDKAESYLDQITNEEARLSKVLNEEYGPGALDLNNKVFIPKE